MAQRADALAASWQPGQHIAVERSMDALAFDILTRAMFAGPVHPDILPIIQTWLGRRIGAMQQTLSPMPRWIQSLPIPGRARFQPKAIAPLHQALDRITASYRADGADHNDLLTLLMNAEDETGAKMTDQQIREELVTLLVGKHQDHKQLPLLDPALFGQLPGSAATSSGRGRRRTGRPPPCRRRPERPGLPTAHHP